MPFQSIISSPFFKAFSADSGAILATKTVDCFSYGNITEKKKTHAALGYKKREKERIGGEGGKEKTNDWIVFKFGLNQHLFSKLNPLFVFSISVVELRNQSSDLYDRPAFKMNIYHKLKVWGPIIILKSWFGQIRGLIA